MQLNYKSNESFQEMFNTELHKYYPTLGKSPHVIPTLEQPYKVNLNKLASTSLKSNWYKIKQELEKHKGNEKIGNICNFVQKNKMQHISMHKIDHWNMQVHEHFVFPKVSLFVFFFYPSLMLTIISHFMKLLNIFICKSIIQNIIYFASWKFQINRME